jgi:hypothetical protein
VKPEPGWIEGKHRCHFDVFTGNGTEVKACGEPAVGGIEGAASGLYYRPHPNRSKLLCAEHASFCRDNGKRVVTMEGHPWD